MTCKMLNPFIAVVLLSLVDLGVGYFGNISLNTDYSLFSTLIIVFVIPVWVGIVVGYSRRSSLLHYFNIFTCAVLIILLAIALRYLAWGITTGRLLEPDGETVLWTILKIKASFCVFGFVILVPFLIRYFKNRYQRDKTGVSENSTGETKK